MTRQDIPFFLLLSTIATLPFAGIHFFVLRLPIYAPELPVIFASALFLWQKRYQDIFSNENPPAGIIVSTGAILLGLMLSALSGRITVSELGIIKAWFFFPMLFGWLLFQTARTPRHLRQALLVWFAAVASVSLVALEYFFQAQLTYDGRLKAFYLSPNYLALFLFPGILLGWYFLRQESVRFQQKSIPHLAGIIFSLIAIGSALYLTRSYTVIIATIIAFLVTIFPKNKLSVLSALGGGMILVACVWIFFATQIHTRKFQDFLHLSERSSLASRVMIWRSAEKMLVDHPFIGIGPGNFQSVYLEYQKYFPPYLEWAVPHPHNLYLAFWLQTGIVGLIGFLILIALWLQRLYPILFSEDAKKAPATRTLFGIMLATLLIGFLDTPYWKNDLAYMFWLTIASGLIIRLRH